MNVRKFLMNHSEIELEGLQFDIQLCEQLPSQVLRPLIMTQFGRLCL